MYIDDAVDLSTMTAPGGAAIFNFIGIGGQFDSNSPLDGGYQIIPRGSQDIIPLLALNETDNKTNVVISPNPTSDILEVTSSKPHTRIDVMTTTGKIMASSKFSSIDISFLNSGVYIIQVSYKDGFIYSQKIIKM